MNETEKKYHRISPNLYKVLYQTKQLLNENIPYYVFKAFIKQYTDEIQKLKRPELKNKQ